MANRLRLAFFSPLPPIRSGIADFSAALLPYLAQETEITLFVDQPDRLHPTLRAQYQYQPSERYAVLRHQFDLPIYHIGNNSLHRHIYQKALRYPGIAVLHDIDLSQFLTHELMAVQDNFPAYIRELAHQQGPAGYHFGRQLWLNPAGATPPPTEFNKRLIRRSLGLIVHNENARLRVAAANPDRPVAHIPLLVNNFPAGNLRHKLELPEDAFVFATIGQLNRFKQIEWCLEQFATIRQDFPQAHFLLVGEALQTELNLPEIISRFGLTGAVHYVGYVEDPADFLSWTAAADVVVALREPTLGETSAGALNALASARPLIVFAQGWYDELTENVALKLPVLDKEAFKRALSHFLENPPAAQTMGASALEYVQEHHSAEVVAARYNSFLHEVMAC